MEQNHLYDIALTLCKGIGAKGAASLIELCGSAEDIFSKSSAELFDLGIKPRVAEALQQKESLERAEQIANQCAAQGVSVLVKTKSADYPTLLKECGDAPHILYKYGNIDLNSKKLVSIVGTRRASDLGKQRSDEIVAELANAYDDIVIVSGLAFGIDKQAHLAALHNNVPTVAILPGWVLDITPSSHRELARRIVRSGGAILSDMPPQTVIGKASFLSRNRLIAGVSSATIVVESPEKSGSTSTANIAHSYDRAVFALPGRSSDTNAYGTNLLIKNGKAILYQDVSDLATELGWVRRTAIKVDEKVLGALPDYLRRVYDSMPQNEPITLDEISETLDLGIGEASSALMQLETATLIKSIPGGLYIRARF